MGCQVSKTTFAENDIAKWVFQKVSPAWASDNTNLYLALHVADPGEEGTQDAYEVSYTGYARVPVPRSALGWVVSSGVVSNVAAVDFGTCTSGSATATHMTIGTAASGAGLVLYFGALSSTVPISAGVTPHFEPGALSVSDE